MRFLRPPSGQPPLHGHVDEETTFNIGTIQGGTATNIVPDCCVLTGESKLRSWESVGDSAMTERIFTEEAQKINAGGGDARSI